MRNSEDKNTTVFNNKNDYFFDLSNSRFEYDLYFQFIYSISHLINCGAPIGDVVISLPRFLENQKDDINSLEYKGLTITTENSIAAFAESIMSAKINSRGLFVVRELIDVDLGILFQLAQIGIDDPYIGVIQPRFSDVYTDDVYLLPSNSRYENSTFSKAALRFLPSKILNADFISPILFLTKQAIQMGQVEQYSDLDDALLDFIVGIRRQGFRNLVNCKVMHPISILDGCIYKNWSDNQLLDKELKQSREFLSSNPESTLESILKYGIENHDGIRYKILLDCSGVSAHNNGTSEAVIGYLTGISNASIDCLKITILINEDSCKFHNLTKKFPHFRIISELPDDSFVIALSLSQLWSMDSFKSLHSRSVYVSCVMFDTISWDLIYTATEKLNSFWRVMPNLIDSIFFISTFSKDRFNYRFPAFNNCRNIVSYLTLDKCLEINPYPIQKKTTEKYVFIMGNSLDHKRVDLTTKLLLNSFPKLNIVKIGGVDFNSDLVVNLDAGNIPEDELIEYMRYAELVIYPSCYEGFGLPVLESLMLGKPTLVQESELWKELASLVSGVPNIVQFNSHLDLIEKTGQLLLTLNRRPLPLEDPMISKLSLKSHEESVKSILDECIDLIYLGNCDRWVFRQNIINSFR